MARYLDDLLILAGFGVAVYGMYQLAPWLIAVWIGLLLIVVGLYRTRGNA